MRHAAALVLLAALAAADDLKAVQEVRPAFPVAQWRLEDLDGDGKAELLLVGAGGEIRTWTTASPALATEPKGALTLPDPRHALLALADVFGEGGPRQLLVLSREGAVAYALGADRAFAAEGRAVAPRARFRLRTNEPRFADVVEDVNRDGLPDLVVPGAEATELWLRGAEGFRRAARIAVDITRNDDLDGDALSDELVSAFFVPRLSTEDVNGDGRPDLVVRAGRTRAFHLQREDGAIPPEPDVTLDLEIFRDTTPPAPLRPGRTLAGSDRPRFVSADLDDDGIPDYVIAHRRKVWVFHGNRERPQFVRPTAILKVSDDLTLLLVAGLDDDRFPDLLLFKVQIPTLASLVFGLVSEFDIEISALGYRSEAGQTFGRTPAWRSELTVRVPPIVRLLRNPGEILGRFEDVGRKFRAEQRADLDGDGSAETLLLAEDRTRLEVWRGRGEDADTEIDLDATLRRVLFEDEDSKWDFERILAFLERLAERRTRDLTGGRPADLVLQLREGHELLDHATGDLDGDGRAEIVLRYAPPDDPGASLFEVVRLAR